MTVQRDLNDHRLHETDGSGIDAHGVTLDHPFGFHFLDPVQQGVVDNPTRSLMSCRLARASSLQDCQDGKIKFIDIHSVVRNGIGIFPLF